MRGNMRRIALMTVVSAWLSVTPPALVQALESVSPPYNVGETLSYEIKWDPPRWMVFLPATYTAGWLTLRMEEQLTFQSAPAYRLTANAQSSGILPKLLRISVQHYYESWVDARRHCLRKSLKQLREGKKKRDIEIVRNENQAAHLRETDVAVQPPQEKRNAEISNIPPCVQDLLSALYVVRLNRFAVNDQYPLEILDEGRVKTIQIQVQKKERIQVNSVTRPAIKVETIALFGGLFKSGGKMVIWVSDDERKIPLKFDAQVKYGHIFGSLKSSRLP